MRILTRLFRAVMLLITVLEFAQSQASNPIDITIDRSGVLLRGKFYVSEGTGIFPAVILLNGFPGNETDVLGIGSKLYEAGISALTFITRSVKQVDKKDMF